VTNVTYDLVRLGGGVRAKGRGSKGRGRVSTDKGRASFIILVLIPSFFMRIPSLFLRCICSTSSVFPI